METKLFGDKKIIIRKPARSDLKKIKKFQDFINALVMEEAKILRNEKANFKDEKEFLEKIIKLNRNKSRVYLVAECNDKVVATTSIELQRWRKNHIGKFAIAIADGYRGMGLGTRLMTEIIKLAKKELNPKPKMIQSEVYTNNKPAVGLYKKMGFKIVAKLPKQIQRIDPKKFDDMTEFLQVIGLYYGGLQATKTMVYLYKGVELDLVKVPGWGYYFEAEISINPDFVNEANKKIDSVCHELGLNTLDEKGFYDFCNELNERPGFTFDLKKEKFSDIKKRFSDYF